jgi:hypothetical protein
MSFPKKITTECAACQLGVRGSGILISVHNLTFVTVTAMLTKFKLILPQLAVDLINSGRILVFCCNVNFQEVAKSRERSAVVAGFEAKALLLRPKQKCTNSRT